MAKRNGEDGAKEKHLEEFKRQLALERFQEERPQLWLQSQRVGKLVDIQAQLDNEIFPEGSCFLHGNLVHIFFNMFALFMFGRALETYWGGRRLVMFYLVCVLTAALTQLLVQSGSGAQEEVIGASGGVFGVLLAFAWYFPTQRIILLFPPIPMPAWLFVTVYGLLELFFGVTGRQQGVAHFAHLGGMLGGALCILFWRTRRRLSS